MQPSWSGEYRQIRWLVRQVTDGLDDAARLERARAFCGVALGAYWSRVTGGTWRQPMQRCPLTLAVLPDQLTMLARVCAREVAPASKPLAAYHLSSIYTALLPDELRSSLGVFFTPPAIVERLLDLVEEAGGDWTRHAIVDPAAGGGAFLAPVASRMAARLAAAGADSRSILDSVRSRLWGVEIDPFSSWMAWVFLEIALWEICMDGRCRLENPIRVADALDIADGQAGTADIVIGNPPYGKTTPPPAVRQRYARSLFGHANNYGLFTDLGVRIARPGGLIAYVTPASFLGGQYFKNLRALLALEAPPVAIDFITDRTGVFADVLQETVLVVLGRGRARRPVAVHFNRPDTLDAPCDVSPIGKFPLPARGDAPWVLPRTRDDIPLVRRLARVPHRLGDYGFKVSTGPLVWNRHKPQLAQRPGRGHFPLIWAESIGQDGQFRLRALRRNHAPYFRLERGQEHLLTRDTCVLVQRTTAKEQNRRLVAAVLPQEILDEHGGVVVENHLNVVRNGLPASEDCSGVLTPRTLWALLNSAIADQVFRCINGSVAVSAYEIEALPVPGPEVMREFGALIARDATSEEIDQFLHDAYHARAAQLAL